MSQCPHCHAWDADELHVCPPLWRVWWADGGDLSDEGRQIYADSAPEAVEQYARQLDRDNDHEIARGEPIRLCVQRIGADAAEAREYLVSGELVPEYRVRLKVNP